MPTSAIKRYGLTSSRRGPCPIYDERILSFPRTDHVSLLTLDGRAEMPFRVGAYQQARWSRVRGQADLLYRNGTFYLALTVDAPEAAPMEPVVYLGVDLGIIP